MRRQKIQISNRNNNQPPINHTNNNNGYYVENTNDVGYMGRNACRDRGCYRNRDLHTQKTIQQLKISLSSIQKMIQRSQQLLRNTKPLNPRQVRSDSLELKIPNRSKSKSKNTYNNNSNNSNYINIHELDLISGTGITRNNTNQQTLLSSTLKQGQYGNVDRLCNRNNQKRPYLFIQTQQLQVRDQDRYRQTIIANLITPTSTITRKLQPLQQSFTSSIQSPYNPYNYGRRLKTQALNDSYQRSFLGGSLQRCNTIDRNQNIQNEQRQTKRIILKKNKNKNPNLNIKNIRPIVQLQQNSRKPRRQWIFQQSKNSQRIKPGKYSYANTSTTTSNNIAKRPSQQPQRQPSPKHQQYSTINREGGIAELEQFYQKLKQFGFVQRYLTFTQIGFIFQYLKRSEIPQHRWPLYVVDKVYQKMHANPPILKQ